MTCNFLLVILQYRGEIVDVLNDVIFLQKQIHLFVHLFWQADNIRLNHFEAWF